MSEEHLCEIYGHPCKELDDAWAEFNGLSDLHQKTKKELAIANIEIEEMKNVLLFYSRFNNYATTSTGFAAQYDPVIPEILKDKGQRAWKVLNKKELEK